MHSAAKHGCYDIGQILVVDYGLDPQEAAEAGAGMGGKTPYDLCVGAREESVAKGEPEKYVRNTPLLFLLSNSPSVCSSRACLGKAPFLPVRKLKNKTPSCRRCEPDYWVEVMEEAMEFKEKGG